MLKQISEDAKRRMDKSMEVLQKELASILTYHVVAGRLSAADVMKQAGAVSVQGLRLDFAKQGEQVTVDGARVVRTDIQCTNGIIHVIDAVVLPASTHVVETAVAAGRFQTLIAAAKADGHIDASERSRIMDKVHLSGLGAEAEAFIEAELAKPIDLDALVASAKTEEQRVEIYTASRLTIEPDTRTERGYLDMLAGRLGLPDALVDHIEATVASAKVSL